MVASRHIASRSRQAGQMAVWVLAIACALLVAPRAYADLNLPPSASAAGLPGAGTATNLADVQFSKDVCTATAEQVDEPVARPVVDLEDLSTSLVVPAADRSSRQASNLVNEPANPSTQRQIKTLPPPPSSFGVALSGLATLGAFRLARQVKQINLASVPEWYHAEGPDQVGHAFVLDLHADRSLVPVCWYEPVVTEADPVALLASYELWRGYVPCLRSQYFVSTIAPRSPPSPAVAQ